MFKNWMMKRKIAKQIADQLTAKIAAEYAQQERFNSLINTNNFSEVIRELFAQTQTPGAVVTIKFANGNEVKIENKGTDMPRDFEKPYF